MLFPVYLPVARIFGLPSFAGILLVKAVGRILPDLFPLPFLLPGFLALGSRAVLLIRIPGAGNEKPTAMTAALSGHTTFLRVNLQRYMTKKLGSGKS
jgi:hypothetical protein